MQRPSHRTAIASQTNKGNALSRFSGRRDREVDIDVADDVMAVVLRLREKTVLIVREVCFPPFPSLLLPRVLVEDKLSGESVRRNVVEGVVVECQD